ncbi:MAG TPA: MFS transporter [Candidatus Saccharimonadales bacterium]|nr:MFS transporter [Candidatus Saccharimonadales bacterium]
MTPFRKKIILAVACLANFMVVLDVAIVNVALPTIKHTFNLSQGTLQWIVIAYSLLLGGFLLLGGRLGDLMGKRRVLIAGLVIFSAASLVAGLTHSISLLITARGIQGFGAALVAPAALSIVAHTFTEARERNSALGIYGAIGGTSASVGVIASGLLTDGPGWRWVFFINIPIGIALIALASIFLPKDEPVKTARRFDALGASTVTAALLLFVYAINKGADYGWGSVKTLGLFGVSALLVSFFAWIESRSQSPILPGSVLKNRDMVAADVGSFLVFGAIFSFIFLGTLFMQQAFGYSPTKTGVAWLATTLTFFISAGVTGAKLVTQFGVKRLLLTGMTLLGLAMLWLMRAPLGAGYTIDLMPAFIIAGLAGGFMAPALQVAALARAKNDELGLASGLVAMMQEIGGAVAIATVSAILVAKMHGISHIASSVARQTTMLNAFHTGFMVIAVIAAVGVVTVSVAFSKNVEEDVDGMDPMSREEAAAIAIGEAEV